jgi:ATP-binding cassette subfamily B protein
VVRGVDLRIGSGEKIAIVGENGAGKTTLVKLLIGLYRPDAGRVRLDGEPLTADSALAARRRIAAVFQDYATFELTARENVAFGDLACLPEDETLAVALERAGLPGLVEGQPEGYDTYLGRQFGETDLSGGQWQRVALARAFVRDADLLVLDEPTAALDPLAELALYERFAALVEGRTAIMISHRLGMARLADRVVVLEGGEIAEQGRHDELVDAGGAYARMFAAQAQWYR